LIIGAGPIAIGQACEFDYSGAQACKALREEGYRVILVNSNPGHDHDRSRHGRMRHYIEPINWRDVSLASSKEERPDAVLPTIGGQTALNTALDLEREGVLAKFGVEMIGATRDAIDMAEDRELFRNAMREIGLASARSLAVAHSSRRGLRNPSHVLGLSLRDPSVVHARRLGRRYRDHNREEFETIVLRGLDASPTTEVLIEESILGWKEFEMEVVRDRANNCIIICSIENLDPMGVPRRRLDHSSRLHRP
jgi:carbamoyl-phosphate synthase large subunit